MVVFIIAFGVCIDAVWASDERSIKKLRDAFVALAPDVDPGEAELVSVTAHTATRSLAREYRFVKGFQTFLQSTLASDNAAVAPILRVISANA